MTRLRYNNDRKPQKHSGIVFFDRAGKRLTMKINQMIPVALMFLALFSCQSDNREEAGEGSNEREEVPPKNDSPTKLLEYLVGEWELQSGSGQQGNAAKRLTFTDEARYIARSDNQTIDSGAYRMNEQLRNLYLESHSSKQPREYELDLQQDVMRLTPKGQQGEGESLTYRRIGS